MSPVQLHSKAPADNVHPEVRAGGGCSQLQDLLIFKNIDINRRSVLQYRETESLPPPRRAGNNNANECSGHLVACHQPTNSRLVTSRWAQGLVVPAPRKQQGGIHGKGTATSSAQEGGAKWQGAIGLSHRSGASRPCLIDPPSSLVICCPISCASKATTTRWCCLTGWKCLSGYRPQYQPDRSSPSR